MSQATEDNWANYYKATANHPPRETLTKALEFFDAEQSERLRRAIDLGCGAGVDTRELLRRGWDVLAIDQQREAIERLTASVPAEAKERLQTQIASFDQVELVPCVLITASYSLPFCPPAQFTAFWEKIVTALQVKGRFAGHFFGVRDTWDSTSPDMTFHTSEQVNELLTSFEIEYLSENEEDGQTALGKSKHWHVFSVVARKRL